MTREEFLKKHNLTEEDLERCIELKMEAHKMGFAVTTSVDLAIMEELEEK